ncbi:hypothetical protein [Streptomyces sp. NPDC046821]|uniref:hypothetical protein n=1 Tax=Streptomyces sp. NPDC046821 TaxID=3154702 RepID=UPI0033C9046B
MSEVPTAESAPQSAYDRGMEMSLLLASSAPAPWGAAVHEAARILADRPWTSTSRSSAELSTLSLLLFARTYTGDRTPQDVPIAELRAALDGPADQEPAQVLEEIEHALTETGQGCGPVSTQASRPLWGTLSTVCDQYASRLGVGALADELEPPVPGPSALRGAATRLVEFLSTYPSPVREQATAPEVAPGPLVIESKRIEMVSRDRIMPLHCPDSHRMLKVLVDGRTVTMECEHGHGSGVSQLDAARVRMAASRATGTHPSTQGTHTVKELLILTADSPRHEDPRQINVSLQQSDVEDMGGRVMKKLLQAFHDRAMTSNQTPYVGEVMPPVT